MSRDQKLFDNEKWVSEHLPGLRPTDPNETLMYVLGYHPLSGCAASPMPRVDPSASTQELARLADAVCVCCCEHLGYTPVPTSIDEIANATSIGNIAYIALHHSSPEVRMKFEKLLDDWKTQQFSLQDERKRLLGLMGLVCLVGGFYFCG
jgi:hypothetical protein